MTGGIDCELCSTPTVERVRTGPTDIEVWVCSRCGDLKRWCPDCDQGWIRRMRVAGASADVYVCDECEATWLKAPEREQDIVSLSQVPGLSAKPSARNIQIIREQG
jgi:hypothetical protein